MKILTLISIAVAIGLAVGAGHVARADDGTPPTTMPDFGSGDGSGGDGVAPDAPQPVDPDDGDPGSDDPTTTTSTDNPTTTDQPTPTVTTSSPAVTTETATVVVTPPPRGLYCHVVDGVWKVEDLVRNQENDDPYWAAQGPWRDAYYDPVTGVGSCDFPEPAPTSQPPAVAAATTTTAKATPSVTADVSSAKAVRPTEHHSGAAVQLPALSVPKTSSTPKAVSASADTKPAAAADHKPTAKKAPGKTVGLPPLSTTPPTG